MWKNIMPDTSKKGACKALPFSFNSLRIQIIKYSNIKYYTSKINKYKFCHNI